VEDATDAGVTPGVLPAAEVVERPPVLEVNKRLVEEAAVPLVCLLEIAAVVGIAGAPTKSIVTCPSGEVYCPVL
jgi:hypothetical protein